jgi:hypothetical protein
MPAPEPELETEELIEIPEVTPMDVVEEAPKKKRGRQPKEPEKKNPVIASRAHEGYPVYRTEWEGRDVFVGFPCYKTTNPATAWSLVALALDFGRDKIRFDMEIGDAMIYHARNRLAEKFLETDAKWCLMIDDDIIPAIGRPGFLRNMCRIPENITDKTLERHVLHRLMGAGKTLIGGAYFGRQKGGRLMSDLTNRENDAKTHADIVSPCKWVGTGCILIHRKVFEDIKKTQPELKPEQANQPFDFFRPLGAGVGEDISFCTRAEKAGHQPHIDFGIPLYHVGYHCFGAGTV